MPLPFTFQVVLILFIIIILSIALRILRKYERAVVFRLGRYVGTRGPGLIFLVPFIERMERVSLRRVAMDVPRQNVIDFRSERERGREQRARSALEQADEAVALELAWLSLHLDRLDYKSDAYKAACLKIREIGTSLCQNGGSDRMDLVCYRVYFLYGDSSHVRRNWDGICGWYY